MVDDQIALDLRPVGIDGKDADLGVTYMELAVQHTKIVLLGRRAGGRHVIVDLEARCRAQVGVGAGEIEALDVHLMTILHRHRALQADRGAGPPARPSRNDGEIGKPDDRALYKFEHHF